MNFGSGLFVFFDQSGVFRGEILNFGFELCDYLLVFFFAWRFHDRSNILRVTALFGIHSHMLGGSELKIIFLGFFAHERLVVHRHGVISIGAESVHSLDLAIGAESLDDGTLRFEIHADVGVIYFIDLGVLGSQVVDFGIDFDRGDVRNLIGENHFSANWWARILIHSHNFII